MNTKWVKPLFLISGIYDAALGVAFLFFSSRIFDWFGVTPPNHFAYVQFPAILLIIFSVMFFQIAADPVKHRPLMLYGMALKLSYSGIVFFYKLTQGIPHMWLPWAWADMMFFLLFAIAWAGTARQAKIS